VKKLEIPRRAPEELVGVISDNKHIYASAVLCCFFLDTIAPDHSWRARLIDLVSGDIWRQQQMGFPLNWQALPIWGTPP